MKRHCAIAVSILIYLFVDAYLKNDIVQFMLGSALCACGPHGLLEIPPVNSSSHSTTPAILPHLTIQDLVTTYFYGTALLASAIVILVYVVYLRSERVRNYIDRVFFSLSRLQFIVRFLALMVITGLSTSIVGHYVVEDVLFFVWLPVILLLNTLWCILLYIRRINDTNLSPTVAILGAIPVANLALWLLLIVYPSRSQIVMASEGSSK